MSDKLFKCLTVRIGDQWGGIDVTSIIEVLYFMAFKPVPTLRDDILGFITVRNEVMPLIDMRRRFGITEVEYRLDIPIVALREKHGPIALIFDAVDQVEDIPRAQITPLQSEAQFPDIYAVAKLSDQLVLLLQTDTISQAIHTTDFESHHA
ncbi:MAG: chemotaxis protein CheW [Chloroflexi bacterium]|nr:chemotaxis protein CheW [Chloroflexota bacterium]MCC6895057.1 chemotaxis protein CheW [Anaerolineae bacterium]